MTWAGMSTEERRSAIWDLAHKGHVELEMQRILSAPDGSIRVIARRHGIAITKVAERRAQVAAPHTRRPASVWDMTDDDRRRAFAARERRGAHNTLKSIGGGDAR